MTDKLKRHKVYIDLFIYKKDHAGTLGWNGVGLSIIGWSNFLFSWSGSIIMRVLCGAGAPVLQKTCGRDAEVNCIYLVCVLKAMISSLALRRTPL